MPSTNFVRSQRAIEEKLIVTYKNILAKKWALPAIIISFCLTIAVLADTHSNGDDGLSTPNDGSLADLNGLDTYIPTGFVLLPIEIQNLTSLDAIIGRFGVVDLYIPGESQAIARSIKIVRSPRNNEQFSILVPENQSGPLVKASVKPFFAIVQNPTKAMGEVRAAAKPSRIVIDN